MSAFRTQGLQHATHQQREHYIAWLLQRCDQCKPRSPMRDHFQRCVAMAGDPEENFYAR